MLERTCSDSWDWHIPSQEKVFQFHSQEFVNGCVDAFCSITGPGASSDADQVYWDCSQRSSSAT
jgi:hypothetical protein